VISNRKLLLISIFVLMTSLSLQGCGVATRVLLRASNMARNKSSNVECFPADEAKNYVGRNVCLTGRVVQIIDVANLLGWAGKTGMQYWVGDQLVLMGREVSFPDAKRGDCVAVLGMVREYMIAGEAKYYMDIDAFGFQLYSATGCQ